MNPTTVATGWTPDLVKRVLNEGGMLSPFNEAFLKIVMRRPVQALSADAHNRFFQQGAPEFGSPTLVPFAVAQAAAAELGAVPADDTHRMYGRTFKVLARFRGEHYVKQANSFMAAHPGSSLLADIDGQAIIASSEDSGTQVQRLANLQALGFKDESDYRNHQRTLQAARDLAVTQKADSIAAGSTAF